MIDIDSMLYFDVLESIWNHYWHMNLKVCDAKPPYEDPYKQPRWGIAGPVLFYLPLAVGFRFPSGVARWTFLVELDGRFASVSGASGFGVKESLLTRPDVAEYFLIGASLYDYKIGKSYMRAKCMGNNCLQWKFRTQKPINIRPIFRITEVEIADHLLDLFPYPDIKAKDSIVDNSIDILSIVYTRGKDNEERTANSNQGKLTCFPWWRSRRWWPSSQIALLLQATTNHKYGSTTPST